MARPKENERAIISLLGRVENLEAALFELSSLGRKNLSSFAFRSKHKSHILCDELHTFFSLITLGFNLEEMEIWRFIPVRLYTDSSSKEKILELENLLIDVLDKFGFAVSDTFPGQLGSWYRKWFARSKETLSRPEVQERLEKIERAIELKGVDLPQAEADEKIANSIGNLIKSTENTDRVAIQIGTILFAKFNSSTGAVIVARTLTQRELSAIEKNRDLLSNPESLFANLLQIISTKSTNELDEPLAPEHDTDK